MELIDGNIKKNASITTANLSVMELDFLAKIWQPDLEKAVACTEIVLAADGKNIYIFCLFENNSVTLSSYL